MKKHLLFTRITAVAIVLIMALGAFVACNEQKNPEESTTASKTEGNATEDFDFSGADMSQYIDLDPSVYSDMNITVSDIYEINDKNVKSYIDGLLKEYPQPVKVTDRPVVKGDTVYIYYQGLLDGVAFEGGTYAETATSEPYALKIGSGSFIDGFEDGLIGVIPEQTSKENPAALTLTFPENYHSKDLAGKTVIFNVYIKYISNETCVPEYNEDTIKNVLGFTPEGSDVFGEFEDHIKTILQEEQNNATLAEISKILLENVTVKSYPQQSVDYWYDYYVDQIQQYVDYYTQYGMSVTFEQMATQMLGLSSGEDWKTALTDLAKDNVKSRMIYYTVAQQNNLSVSDDDYKAMVKYFMEYYGNKYSEKEIIDGIGEDVIRENALIQKVDELLFSNSSVSFKPADSK